MPNSTLTVVIPVFNEIELIERCLTAVLKQDEVDEVIVVDNNSSDGTPEMVAEYARRDGRLRQIHEVRQGVIPARNAGLNAATGELIARIDADSIVSVGWAARIKEFFTDHPEFDVLTGGAFTSDRKEFPTFRLLMKLLSRGAMPEFSETRGLQGSNMAFRRSAWESVRDVLHDDPDIWEDGDMSIGFIVKGHRMAWVNDLEVEISNRRLMTNWRSYCDYTAQLPRTLRVNGWNREARLIWINVAWRRFDYLVYRALYHRKASTGRALP